MVSLSCQGAVLNTKYFVISPAALCQFFEIAFLV